MVRPGAAGALIEVKRRGCREASTESPYGPCGDRGCIGVLLDRAQSGRPRSLLTGGIVRFHQISRDRCNDPHPKTQTRPARGRADGHWRPSSPPLAVVPARAADPTPATPVSEQDPAARALLLEMARFIARAPGLRVTMRSEYDAIQADGQRIEFGERRQILMQRPDKFRVEVERSDGERGTVVFDGRWITVFKPSDNVYARVEKAGNVDQALVYMVRDLHATMPLARMFTTGFPASLDQRVTSVALVEEFSLFDVPTDHLAVRSDEVDMQLWIARGQEPLPRRVVITYKNAPGQPQFRADLYDWKIGAELRRRRVRVRSPGGCRANHVPCAATAGGCPGSVQWRTAMSRRPRLCGMLIAVVSVVGLVLAGWADDAAGRGGGRGGGGGGGMSRSSPARGGGMSSRPAPSVSRSLQPARRHRASDRLRSQAARRPRPTDLPSSVRTPRPVGRATARATRATVRTIATRTVRTARTTAAMPRMTARSTTTTGTAPRTTTTTTGTTTTGLKRWSSA